MIIERGRKTIEKGTKQSLVDINFGNYILYVFQGTYSEHDILLKYSCLSSNGRVRTPKHFHWVVDLLLKKNSDELLTNGFLNDVKSYWEKCSPITKATYDEITSVISSSLENVDLEKYSSLNDYGEYPIEFLFIIIVLLAVQEKTNAKARGQKPVMFISIINELLKSELDIFKIMSVAGFRGR